MEPQVLLCFIDWLGLSVRITDNPRPIAGFVWKDYSATNVWAKRRVLWTEQGDRVCTLLSEPRSSLLDAHSGLLEFENEWFYHGAGPDDILQTLLASVFFEVTGISRVDLCVDFVPSDNQSDIIRGLSEGRYYVQGKRSGCGFWSTNTCDHLNPQWLKGKIPHSQSWGHKTSDIRWKLYYKTRELWEAGGWKFAHKPYIIDQWRMADMDVSNVWRLEVSCRHLNNLQLYGQVIDLRCLREHRAELMIDFYNGRFVVRKNEGHSDKSNDKVVPFLPIDKSLNAISTTPAKRLAERHGRITLLRHLVKSLEDEHILLDDESRYDVFDHIAKMVQRDGLDNYFRAMTGMWLDDFISAKEVEAREQFDSKCENSVALFIERKGSTAALQRYDVPQRGKQSAMPHNEQFDNNVGESRHRGLSERAKQQQAAMDKRIKKMSDSIKSPPPSEPSLFDVNPK